MIGVIWSMNLTLKLQTYKGIRTTVDFRRTIINGIKLDRSYLAVKELLTANSGSLEADRSDRSVQL